MTKKIRVDYKGGGSKTYDSTGYKLQTHQFKGGAEQALILFKGRNKKPIALRLANIKTWKVIE
jgi:hypothetical protein